MPQTDRHTELQTGQELDTPEFQSGDIKNISRVMCQECNFQNKFNITRCDQVCKFYVQLCYMTGRRVQVI